MLFIVMDVQKLFIIAACLTAVIIENVDCREEFVINKNEIKAIRNTPTYSFKHGQTYKGFKVKANRNPVYVRTKKIKKFMVQNIDSRPGCLGVIIKSETVVLSCFNGKVNQTGCFDVIKKRKANKQEKRKVCIQLLNRNCRGITPKNWILLFDDCPLKSARTEAMRDLSYNREDALPYIPMEVSDLPQYDDFVSPVVVNVPENIRGRIGND